MSEKEITRWSTFSERPNVINAVRYVVVEKDGKKLSNFLKIVERAGVNGRVYQDGDVVRVASGGEKMTLRAGMWLVMTVLGEFEVYTDEQFQKLFESGSAVGASTEGETEGADATETREASSELQAQVDSLGESLSSLQTAFTEATAEAKKANLSSRTSEAEKEISAMSKQIAFMKKGAENAKSKTSKS